jgi:predicted LPLAT superfamily acyltransferase
VYQLFISQGRNLIDRYYCVSGLGQFDIEIQGYDRIKSLLQGSEKGIILLTAHVGNWQVTMTALERLEKTVYLLMTPEENAAVKDSLNIDSEKDRVRVISPEQFLGGVLEIMKVIDEGSIVSIMGDRSYGHSTVGIDLLGSRAYLPYSAFTIAMSARCPVVVLLSAKTDTYRYRVDVSNVIEPRAVSRSEKRSEIESCVQTYAKVLEDFAREYPLQWFLFCDIWNEGSEETVN